MAVAPMKLVTVFGPVNDLDRAIQSCMINRQFHPESALEILKENETDGLHAFDARSPYADLLHAAYQLADDLDYELDYCEFDAEKTNVDSVMSDFTEISDKFHELISQKEELLLRHNETEQIIKPLEHLRGFTANLHEFFNLTYVKSRFGRLPRETYEAFSQHIEARTDVFFIPTSIERRYVYGMYLTPRVSVEQVDAYFASLHFESIQLSDHVEGTASEAISVLTRRDAEIMIKTSLIDSLIEKLKSENRARFLSGYSYIRYMNDSYNFRAYAAHSEDSFIVPGWVPEDELEEFLTGIDNEENISYVIDEPDDNMKIEPPVMLKNNRISKTFAPFVGMYGLPSYNEMDPTLLISITYTLLFGIMFGDIGQGLVLIILGIILYKVKGIWLGGIIAYAGVAAVIFGCIYGSIFGVEHLLPGFKVLESSENTNLMLLISVGIGIIFIAFSMLINITNGLRQRDYEKALFSQNGIAGLVFYISVIIAVVMNLMYKINLFSPVYIIFLIVLPLILVFLRRPLGKLVLREEDWKPDGIGDFIVENFFELFEVLLSYATNTISFLRVGAFAISHPGMMHVVFELAGGYENPNIWVVITGNIVVMLIEGLLAGIQVLRLEFYEIFGRFYSGAGRMYKPVIIDYKVKDLSG